MKLSEKGKIMWHKTYGDKDVDYGYSLTGVENNIYITGSYIDTISRNLCMFLLCLDIDGKFLWKKKYFQIYSIGKKVIVSNDKYLLLSGEIKDNNKKTVFLIKLDFKGNIIWKKVYKYLQKNIFFEDLIENENSYLLFVKDKNKNYYIFKIDKINGNLILSKSFNLENEKNKILW